MTEHLTLNPRRAAKILLHQIQDGIPEAVNRFQAVWPQRKAEDVGLQMVQQVLAVEAGCKNWAEYIAKF